MRSFDPDAEPAPSERSDDPPTHDTEPALPSASEQHVDAPSHDDPEPAPPRTESRPGDTPYTELPPLGHGDDDDLAPVVPLPAWGNHHVEPEVEPAASDVHPWQAVPRWFGAPDATPPSASTEGTPAPLSEQSPAPPGGAPSVQLTDVVAGAPDDHTNGICPDNDPACPEFATGAHTIRAVRADTDDDAPEAADAIAELAYHALLVEAELTPKPGLVDASNSGCHSDMDVWTFRASAWAIRPWLRRMVATGMRHPVPDIGQDPVSAAACMADLRRLGIECERAMFTATGGVNTHRGAIYALGLVCGAAGRLLGARRVRRRQQPLTIDDICWEASYLARPDAEADLVRAKDPAYEPVTDGERAYRTLGLPGARGEAASGFASVREVALPAYRRVHLATGSYEAAAIEALMWLYAVNADTTIAADGGMEAVFYVRDRACRWLSAGGMQAPDAFAQLRSMDVDFIEFGVSPGGCADLLAITWFLAAIGD